MKFWNRKNKQEVVTTIEEIVNVEQDIDIGVRIREVWAAVIADNMRKFYPDAPIAYKIIDNKLTSEYDTLTEQHVLRCQMTITFDDVIFDDIMAIPKNVIINADVTRMEQLLDEFAKIIVCKIYNKPTERNYIEINGVKYIKE